MRCHICAVGRLRKSPEQQIIDDYISRTIKMGRVCGITHVSITEVDSKKVSTIKGEAEMLQRAVPVGAKTIVLDERGKLLPSPDFATILRDWVHIGISDLAFLIGGADGIDPQLRANADVVLSFGKMVWPHMFVRMMLAEQIYRAVSILNNSPYHRE